MMSIFRDNLSKTFLSAFSHCKKNLKKNCHAWLQIRKTHQSYEILSLVQPGAAVIILKNIFATKLLTKLAFLTQNTAKFYEDSIVTFGSKNANFFVKIAKISDQNIDSLMSSPPDLECQLFVYVGLVS
jgi:hypothetical protein